MAEQPDWFTVLRQDIAAFRTETRDESAASRKEINERLDKLVTQEAFDAERRRVDERLKSHADDLAEERAERVAQVQAEAASRSNDVEALKESSAKIWSGIRWAIATAVAAAGVVAALLQIGK